MEAKKIEIRDGKMPMTIRINDGVRYQLKLKAAQERRTAGSIVEELLTAYLAEKIPAKG